MITRNVTWAYVPLFRPPTVTSTPLVEGGGFDHGKNREGSSFSGDTGSGNDESESSGKGIDMVTSEADDTEVEMTRSFWGELYQHLRAPEVGYTAECRLTRRAEGLSARVLLMLRLPLTVFRMVPISGLQHCTLGKQRDLMNISPDRYIRLFLKDVRVLKTNGQKYCPNMLGIRAGQAGYRAARREEKTSAAGGH